MTTIDVYRAEDMWRTLVDRAVENQLDTVQVAGSTLPVPIERKFGDIEAVQRYVNLVLSRVAREYGVGSTVVVRARKGIAKATYTAWGAEIAIPPHQSWDRSWAMREIVVLHEIAHHLTPWDGHGSKFVRAFCDIVERFIGPEAGLMMTVLAHQGGVL